MVQARRIPQLNDPLGETLHQLRLNGSLYCFSRLTAPWHIQMPALPGKMMFHLVSQGQCYVQVDGQAPVLLPTGSLALLPHGLGHRFYACSESTSVNFFDLPISQVTTRLEHLIYSAAPESQGELTILTCGVMSFDHLAGGQLLKLLPDLIVVEQMPQLEASWLTSTLALINQEASKLKMGGETILTHLSDILVIQAIRSWIDSDAANQHSWLVALKDKQIGQALSFIHNQPDQPWTVDSLARHIGMSRSGFSAKFTELVGESVKSYLTHWRMQLASYKLKQGGCSIADLALQLGYQSEAAFSRAFKRVMGLSPSAVKQ